MTNNLTDDIPVGDIKFYDNYLPALTAGGWKITVGHSLAHNGSTINADALGATQEFVVSAPQFSLDATEIMSVYPPEGSTGRYGEVLPHIVLKEPLLPWERQMKDTKNAEPWLALLVFEESELVGGDPSSATRTTSAKVSDFLATDGKILKPNIVKEGDVADDAPCAYIQVSTSTFQAVAPRLNELRYLAHCRQVNTGDKAILGLNQHGLFSVVVANRFPALPANSTDPPAKNIVHLVSVEGLDNYLTDEPDFAGHDRVALLTLASWTFYSQADNQENFRGLMENLVSSETSGDTIHAERLWLRLPAPATLNSGDANQAEVIKRIADGFVPLEYHMRTGENSFAWYRGPLTPLLTTALVKPAEQEGPFMTADSAIIYDEARGIFDLSLAAAWEAGRAAALSDKAFGRMLLDFRRRAHQLTDQLHHRLQSDSFSQSQISELDTDTTVQDEFIKILDQQLLYDIGQAANPETTPSSLAPTVDDADMDIQKEIKSFLSDPDAQQLLIDLIGDDLDPISQWLARLMLLYPVPFNYLVADERMLPIESLRFFYLDNNWLNALLDGAQSIGMESSRQTFFFEITHDLLKASAAEAAKIYRSQLLGNDPPAVEVEENLLSGLLLRSAAVSGWPSLAVRPYLNSGELLRVLRMDHLSPTVLLCIFQGVPDYVELSEPQESLRFGVDQDGFVPLRNLIAPSTSDDPALGAQLTTAEPFQVRDPKGGAALYMRSVESRVLDLDPDSTRALVQKLKSALEGALKGALTDFGPADFALQMVKSPEAIIFNSLSRKLS